MSKETLNDESQKDNRLELFGEVNQHALVFPGPKAFEDMGAALDIRHMSAEEHPDYPHAGSNVFVVDLPGGVTQQEYANQLAKVAVILDTAAGKKEADLRKIEYKYDDKPKKFVVLNVVDITASEENLWQGLKAIANYADENTSGYAFVLDKELNLKMPSGADYLDENGDPVVDVLANERLATLRTALASTALMTFNVLPDGYEIDEPNEEELEEFYGIPRQVSKHDTLFDEPQTRTPVSACGIKTAARRHRPIVTGRIPALDQAQLF